MTSRRAAVPSSVHSSRAFLVRSLDLGESDRRLTFFTDAHGVVDLIAKSAWRSRKRFGGILQRYLLLDITWNERPGRFSVLESASLFASYWDIVGKWEKVLAADRLLDLAASLFPQKGRKPRAFEALDLLLSAICRGGDPDQVIVKGGAAFLSISGWGPNLVDCRSCGADTSALFRFVVPEGRIYCSKCLETGGYPLSLGAIRTWRALQAANSSALGKTMLSRQICLELQGVILRYVEWNLGHSLRGSEEG